MRAFDYLLAAAVHVDLIGKFLVVLICSFFVNMGLLFNAASKGSEFCSISISKARMLSVQHSSFPSMVVGSYFLLDGLNENLFFFFSPLEV